MITRGGAARIWYALPMRLLILGDVVGDPGILALAQQLPALRERFRPDLVIANAENAHNGTGLTPGCYRRLLAAGVDAMTLGDHCYKKNQIVPTLESADNLIRPCNLSQHALGRTSMLLRAGDKLPGAGVFVFTVLGRIGMNLPANDPFAAADAMLRRAPDGALVVVEVHAEATSEKVALGWHLSGRCAVVFGTHTHIPTRDARVLPPGVPKEASGGTAYVTDLGMCGPVDSVLGRRVDRVLTYMATSMPAPFDVADGAPQVQGIVVETDDRALRAVSIEPFTQPADPASPPFAM